MNLKLKTNEKSLIANVILALIVVKLGSDSIRYLAIGESSSLVWASWIGEIPTAAEVYGEASSEMPSGENFDDDDEDEELDSSATNDYPDNENNDESYEEPEESRRLERWLGRPQGVIPTNNGRHRRDIDGLGMNPANEELANVIGTERRADDMDGTFNVDDGDEDSWVHDGVDDIQIDPETKQAASEHSYDQDKSIDAEYDPHSGQQSNLIPSVDDDTEPIVNRTRVTTITEVIPTRVDEDASKISERFSSPPETVILSDRNGHSLEPDADQSSYIPASQLHFDQVIRALGQR